MLEVEEVLFIDVGSEAEKVEESWEFPPTRMMAPDLALLRISRGKERRRKEEQSGVV